MALSHSASYVQWNRQSFGMTYDALKQQERRTPEMIQIQFSNAPAHAQIRDCGPSAQRNGASTPTLRECTKTYLTLRHKTNVYEQISNEAMMSWLGGM